MENKNLGLALVLLRYSVALVFFMWALDKLVNPEHAAAVFEKYYKISGLGTGIAYAIGGLQMGLLLAFLLGLWKKWTYGILLVLHAISTVSTWNQLANPWGEKNLLFYAGIPMLAVLFALFLLRDEDRVATIRR